MAWFGRKDEPRVHGPDAIDDAFRTALARLLVHDLDGAEEALASIVRGDSDQVEAYLDLAELYRQRGEIGRAIRMHQNLLLRSDLEDGDRDRALEGLAADFRQGGFLQRAIAAYEELLERQPKSERALRALVRLRADAREFDRAIELQRRLAKRVPEERGAEATLLVDAAEHAIGERRLDDARKLARRAIRRDRELSRAHDVLGVIEAARGKTKAALSAWDAAIELEPRLAASIVPKVEAAMREAGKADDLLPWLEARLASRAGDRELSLARIRVLSARGDTTAAIDAARAWIEQEPGQVAGHAALARAALAGGQDGEALKALQGLLDALQQEPPPLAGESLR